MLQGVNLDDIRKYNASLKQYKDKAASLNAEIEYTNRELDSLCAELTAELGVQVTRENVEEIYNEQIAKINSTLQSGNAVLAKIASEEQALATGAGQMSQPPVTPVTQPVVQPIPSAPTAPNMFAGQAMAGQMPELPKMFNI